MHPGTPIERMYRTSFMRTLLRLAPVALDPPTSQQCLTQMEIRDFYNRGIVFGKDGSCLSGRNIYVLSSGVLTGIEKFLGYSWDDGFFQPVVQAKILPELAHSEAAFPTSPLHVPEPHHYFSYETIGDSSVTVSRLIKVQRLFRECLNANTRRVVKAVAKGGPSGVGHFNSRLSVLQSDDVFALLKYAPSSMNREGITDRPTVEPPVHVIGTGVYGPPTLSTMISRTGGVDLSSVFQ